MDAFAHSRRMQAVLAAVIICGSARAAEAAPPVRRSAPGRLVARAAMTKHDERRSPEPWASEVAPAAALQPAEEFFPPPDMPEDDLPIDDMPPEDMPPDEAPIEDTPGAGLPEGDLPGEDLPAGDMPLEDMPAEDVPYDVPPETAPAEAVPYAAPLLTEEYPYIDHGGAGAAPCKCSTRRGRGGCDCGASCGCGDACSCSSCRTGLIAGVEFTFVKPRFNRNVAFTILDSDDDTFEDFTEIEFDYAFDIAPRAWIGYAVGGGRGWRATYWQYDDEAQTASASPPANGFGAIIPPDFGDVDIGTDIPTDVFTANTRINCYTIDLEATQETSRGLWQLGASYGVRFASMQQDYLARTTDDDDALLGQIDYYRTQRGAGPTLSLTAARELTGTVNLFSTARGSVLFGDSDANFFGGEDLDLATPFNTTRVTTRDDVWTIAEIQVGLRWLGRRTRGGWQPFASGAAEGQSWNGAGNATSEDGDLGFVGFSVGVGLLR